MCTQEFEKSAWLNAVHIREDSVMKADGNLYSVSLSCVFAALCLESLLPEFFYQGIPGNITIVVPISPEPETFIRSQWEDHCNPIFPRACRRESLRRSLDSHLLKDFYKAISGKINAIMPSPRLKVYLGKSLYSHFPLYV